ncbi:hypothetical protein BJ878DRAFT_541282 [Calycina marina]|uniref:Uncharacterized protein n=1 Tax=Calycina marina TaxID=1763456 RepID=A0A9P7Z543_9HELO|nr:hypothetical protein BJ878DRAFT_541282 [Calycina marina]
MALKRIPRPCRQIRKREWLLDLSDSSAGPSLQEISDDDLTSLQTDKDEQDEDEQDEEKKEKEEKEERRQEVQLGLSFRPARRNSNVLNVASRKRTIEVCLEGSSTKRRRPNIQFLIHETPPTRSPRPASSSNMFGTTSARARWATRAQRSPLSLSRSISGNCHIYPRMPLPKSPVLTPELTLLKQDYRREYNFLTLASFRKSPKARPYYEKLVKSNVGQLRAEASSILGEQYYGDFEDGIPDPTFSIRLGYIHDAIDAIDEDLKRGTGPFFGMTQTELEEKRKMYREDSDKLHEMAGKKNFAAFYTARKNLKEARMYDSSRRKKSNTASQKARRRTIEATRIAAFLEEGRQLDSERQAGKYQVLLAEDLEKQVTIENSRLEVDRKQQANDYQPDLQRQRAAYGKEVEMQKTERKRKERVLTEEKKREEEEVLKNRKQAGEQDLQPAWEDVKAAHEAAKRRREAEQAAEDEKKKNEEAEIERLLRELALEREARQQKQQHTPAQTRCKTENGQKAGKNPFLGGNTKQNMATEQVFKKKSNTEVHRTGEQESARTQQTGYKEKARVKPIECAKQSQARIRAEAQDLADDAVKAGRQKRNRETAAKFKYSKKVFPTDKNVAGEDEQARMALQHSFPNGYRKIQTSGEGLDCGLRAVILSFIAQGPAGVTPPTIEELRHIILVDEDINNMNEELGEEGDPERRDNANEWFIDQLAAALQKWGESRQPRLDLRLCWVLANGRANLLERNAPFQSTYIWITNNSSSGQDENRDKSASPSPEDDNKDGELEKLEESEEPQKPHATESDKEHHTVEHPGKPNPKPEPEQDKKDEAAEQDVEPPKKQPKKQSKKDAPPLKELKLKQPPKKPVKKQPKKDPACTKGG